MLPRRRPVGVPHGPPPFPCRHAFGLQICASSRGRPSSHPNNRSLDRLAALLQDLCLAAKKAVAHGSEGWSPSDCRPGAHRSGRIGTAKPRTTCSIDARSGHLSGNVRTLLAPPSKDARYVLHPDFGRRAGGGRNGLSLRSDRSSGRNRRVPRLHRGRQFPPRISALDGLFADRLSSRCAVQYRYVPGTCRRRALSGPGLCNHTRNSARLTAAAMIR